MKPETPFSRYNLLWAIILCYLLPLIVISAYGTLVPREHSNWNILGLGFLLTSIGSLALFWMMTNWEKSLTLESYAVEEVKTGASSNQQKPLINPEEHDFTKRSLTESQQTQIRLLSEIDTLTEEIQKLSNSKKESVQQTEKTQKELEQTTRAARQELELQQNFIRELQEALADQKAISEKKQQQMLQLETKVNDLTYEIKTLLQFAEAHTGSLLTNKKETPVQDKSVISVKMETYQEPLMDSDTPQQMAQKASQQLKQCLEMAQKIKGSQRFGSQIYSLESPADNFSLDLRRLCDRLRSESQSAILLYSPKDNHLLFANNQIKTLTGWSPEKFAQNFFEILLDDSEWKVGVNSLVMRSEAQIQLQIKTRFGPNLLVNTLLGMIPTGIFRNHIIAVVYTQTTLKIGLGQSENAYA